MLKKISMLLVVCMLFGMVFVACQNVTPDESDTNAPTDESTATPTDTESESVTETEEATEPATETEKPVRKKSIDVYLIAGQSNGAGYTIYDNRVLSGLWSSYKTGKANVIYTGRAEHTKNVNTPNVATGVNEFKYWAPAKVGMGAYTDRMGPEVGMAAYLSENYYNNSDGVNKVAGIIKFAHGGTSLFNNQGGENAASGNWVSPSYAEALGIKYTGLTGGLYRGLLKQVKTGVDNLEALGYNDINIKGVFWMQGESDRGNPTEYERAFKFFVDDLRKDLGTIMGEDLSDLAIMIGEISKTSGSAEAGTVAINEKFIAKQREMAEKMDNVYCIASGQYDINIMVNGTSTKVQDGWHWNTADMFAIGELVGECIVKDILGVEVEAE